jgi:hypothetical protein
VQYSFTLNILDMSFLKKFDTKDKVHLLKQFFFDYVWKKSSLNLGLASIIFSLCFLQFTIPQFYISATLREAQQSSSNNQSVNGTAAGLISIMSSEEDSFGEFRSNLYSYVIAQRMWEKGWATEIYAGGDPEKDFNKIHKRQTLSERLGSFLLGYDLYDYYSPHDLQDFISAKVSIDKEIGGSNITVSIMSDDQQFGLDFIHELILESDRYAKEFLIQKSQAIIDGTSRQLAASRNSAITASLAGTINSEYLKIATLDNDMPYHIYFIDPPYSSEYPVSPNTFAIFISNFIIFVVASIMFHFARNNKEDLW